MAKARPIRSTRAGTNTMDALSSGLAAVRGNPVVPPCPEAVRDEDPTPSRPPEDFGPGRFLNRELSWLAFNDRVLEEAGDPSVPLFDRLRFVGIFGTNLDEFLMVRVANLQRQIASGVGAPSDDGRTPQQQLAEVLTCLRRSVARQYGVLREQVLPELEQLGVGIRPVHLLSAEQRSRLRDVFVTHVFPVLTPLAVDPAHPFPHLHNKALNIAVSVARADRRRAGGRSAATWRLAVVQVPPGLRRLVPVPPSPQDAGPGRWFVLLEDLIAEHVGELFPGYVVRAADTAAFRVIRNWDLTIDEEEADDLLLALEAGLRRRDRGAAVRLQVVSHAPPELVERLAEALHLGPDNVDRVDGPLHVADLNALADAETRPGLRSDPIRPVIPPALSGPGRVIDAVARGDILLHHPYESFDPVVRFVEEAADDPDVLAIKMTLYRTSGDSPFVRALSRAAEAGKQVTALVELKARFDEANNIAWAKRLEERWVHVVYGVPGLKTHCKVCLVLRREGGQLRRYVHLGTGNYNPTTARVYTDVSLFTARDDVCDDISQLFNMLTGYAEPVWRKLAMAPTRGGRGHLEGRLLQLIDREAARARAGEPGYIRGKLNALTESGIIDALYRASQAGVDIDLVVRGVCCLRPGVPGLSERIRITSIVDRFLEHGRVFVFGHGDKAEAFISSADWMRRNLRRRIEVLCPVEDGAARRRIIDHIVGLALADTVKARLLQPDGSYTRVSGATPCRSQQRLLELTRPQADGPPGAEALAEGSGQPTGANTGPNGPSPALRPPG